MPSVVRTLPQGHPLYYKSELIEYRRRILRYARSFPSGSELNQRQVALSLRALSKSKKWLGTHTVEGAGDNCRSTRFHSRYFAYISSQPKIEAEL
jgi:hypothetical protein